jgi:hypothetical protein
VIEGKSEASCHTIQTIPLSAGSIRTKFLKYTMSLDVKRRDRLILIVILIIVPMQQEQPNFICSIHSFVSCFISTNMIFSTSSYGEDNGVGVTRKL